MRTNIYVVILVLTSLLPMQAQYFERPSQSGVGSPYFDFVIHRQYAQDLVNNKLTMMATFLYDDLTFIRGDSTGYDAELEMIFAVYNEDDLAVASRTIRKKIHAMTYRQTNLRDEKFLLTSEFVIPSGEYKVLARVTDLNSRKTVQRKVEIEISDYSENEIGISGILFLQKAEMDSQGTLINFKPAISNNFTIREGYFFIYFDLFVQIPEKDIEIRYEMINEEGDADLDSTVTVHATRKINPQLFRVQKNQFPHNRYELRVTVKDGKYKASDSQKFSFFWSDVPETIEDINKALQQMVYIINADSLEVYSEASLQDKKAFFKRFWKDRDPDPSNSINELKNEYFRRINYANANFSAFGMPGWRTDRGRILIKFGFPDDVERRPFEMNSDPYEVWRYYTERKVFVFIDRTGFGDYRLHPDYINVEFE